MKNKSIWLDVKNKALKKVSKDMITDVLIVGGGITGLSILYQLKKTGVKAILVEKNKCGEGVTARSTAKITYLQEKEYMNIRRFGNKTIAYQYLASQISAVRELKNIITKEKINCDLLESFSYLLSNNKSKIIKEYNFLREAKVKGEFLEDCYNFKYAIKVNDVYMFHPVKYVLGLKNILQEYIYENSKLNSFKYENGDYLCNVNNYTIKAKYLVIATHYPYFIYPLLLPFKSHVEKSFLGAKKTSTFENVNAINIDKPTVSFRYHTDGENNYYIYLTNSSASYNIKNIKDNFSDFKDFQYRWSNKDIITNDYIPLIGEIKDNLLIACGYNTWGMTNGTLAGVIIKDIILKKNNKYIALFSPKRNININKIFRLPVDAFGSIKAILKSNASNSNNKNVTYTNIKGKNVIIYKDELGKEHIVLNKCPHMKCGLVFNEVEKTWDCLCHGSRYDIDGVCIEGPSNEDITYKE